MGYEEARDDLLTVQLNLKRMQGTSLQKRGLPIQPASLAFYEYAYNSRLALNDLLVQLLSTRPEGYTEAELRARFAPAPSSGIQENFYDNVVAYCRGLNDYRLAVKNSIDGTKEREIRDFLDNSVPAGGGNLAWVYEDEIDPIDVLSWGRWTKAHLLTGVAQNALPAVNATANDPGLDGGGGDGAESAASTSGVGTIEMPGSKSLTEQMDALKDQFAGFSGAGSNSFSWSHYYTVDDSGQHWSGCVGDPHWGSPAWYTGTGSNSWVQELMSPFTGAQNSWYVHVKVTPPGASKPSFNALGELQHGMGTFFVSHNENVAYGGSLGSPNVSDAFLLRLREDGDGNPVVPYEYYSYYVDTDGSNGTQDTDWVQLTSETYTIAPFPGGRSFVYTVWRAGRFGFILPNLNAPEVVGNSVVFDDLPVIHGERESAWRLKPGDAKNRFFAGPVTNDQDELITSPMVGVLRVPLDEEVGGEAHHSRLNVALWELAHAESIWDCANKFLDHDGGYLTNAVFVDREGRMLGIQAGTIPRRGDDAALEAAGYNSFPDKLIAYYKGRVPVPARYKTDQMFDWVFDDADQIEYLRPGGNGGADDPNFQPYIVFDPTNGVHFPPISVAQDPFHVENPGFLNLSNEMLWHAWSYDTVVEEIDATEGFHQWSAPESVLLQAAIEAGTVYSTIAFGFTAQNRNQSLTDRLMDRTEHVLTGGTAGKPPLTIEESRKVAVDTQSYAPERYTPVDDINVGNPNYQQYPVPVRLVKEVVDHPNHARSPIAEAQKEAAFFDDLWDALYNAPDNTHWAAYPLPDGTTMSLRELWVENAWGNRIFVSNNDALPIEFEMPENFALIDFLWDRSQVGGDARVGDTLMSAAELADLTSLVNDVLVPWDTDTPIANADDRYHMTRTHEGAALVEMHQRGFSAVGNYGRRWQRLRRGEVPFQNGSTTTFVPVTDSGGMPAAPGTGFSATETSMKWNGLQYHSFPIDQLASYYKEPVGLEVPYDALYSSVDDRIVKTHLQPEDIDAIVIFFLKLSGDYIDPENNGGVPSIRKSKYDRAMAAGQSDAFFAASRPGSFPMTRGLGRLATLRRLIEAADFLRNEHSGEIPEFGAVFRTRMFDLNDQLAWPDTEAGAACDGSFIRAIGWAPDQLANGYVPQRGYQPRYIGMGGSHLTLFTLLPKKKSDSTETLPPQSYFWCTATIRTMFPEDPSYTSILPHFAQNELLPTHFSDYADDTSGSTGPTSLWYSP